MPAFCPPLLPEMAESRRVQGQGDENEGTIWGGGCVQERKVKEQVRRMGGVCVHGEGVKEKEGEWEEMEVEGGRAGRG